MFERKQSSTSERQIKKKKRERSTVYNSRTYSSDISFNQLIRKSLRPKLASYSPDVPWSIDKRYSVEDQTHGSRKDQFLIEECESFFERDQASFVTLLHDWTERSSKWSIAKRELGNPGLGRSVWERAEGILLPRTVFYAAGITKRSEDQTAVWPRWCTSRWCTSRWCASLRGHVRRRHGRRPGYHIPVQFPGIGRRRMAVPERASGCRVLVARLDAAVTVTAPSSQRYKSSSSSPSSQPPPPTSATASRRARASRYNAAKSTAIAARLQLVSVLDVLALNRFILLSSVSLPRTIGRWMLSIIDLSAVYSDLSFIPIVTYPMSNRVRVSLFSLAFDPNVNRVYRLPVHEKRTMFELRGILDRASVSRSEMETLSNVECSYATYERFMYCLGRIIVRYSRHVQVGIRSATFHWRTKALNAPVFDNNTQAVLIISFPTLHYHLSVTVTWLYCSLYTIQYTICCPRLAVSEGIEITILGFVFEIVVAGCSG